MATFYVGPRPVLRGQNTNDMVNPYYTLTGKAKGKGTYSYYPLRNTSQLLTGAPDNAHVPGTGRHPGNVLLSQLFTGSTLYTGTTPLAGAFADGTATYEGARYRPLEYRGIAGAKALNGGHAKRSLYYGLYSNFIFDGVAAAEVMPVGYGHGPRTEAQGAPASFGLFRPNDVQGVARAKIFTTNYGQANTTTIYGREHPKEYKGVPSGKAL
jgi:hypothetical protein